jgi:hypothetical protein
MWWGRVATQLKQAVFFATEERGKRVEDLARGVSVLRALGTSACARMSMGPEAG